MKLLAFQNIGNTCYLNSVLQCFVNDPLFHEVLKIETTQNELYPILKKIIDRIDLTNNDDDLMFKYNLNDFVKFIHSKTGMQRFVQQDAHEFLITFLDILVDLNKKFEEIYYGETINVITCKKCNKSKRIHEQFSTLNLNVVSEKLSDNFKEYLKITEHSDPKNLYQCDHCKMETISQQKVYLNKLPQRLIIVLKKYTIKMKVVYPQILNIQETSTSEIKKYHLMASVNHLGHAQSGHYNCYINVNDNFYFIDDDVILLDEEPKCDPGTYFLIYRC
jgi:ubiquitin C-terminal hydrolase